MKKEAVYERIGGNIRRARETRDVTQGDLAHALGVTRTVVTNMETGRQSVKVHQLLLIAQMLEVRPDELLDINLSELNRAEYSGQDLPENLALLVSKFQLRQSRENA